jgi:hypothetical protein
VKLLDVGGFGFWPRLPQEHAGEEVVVQWLLIRRYGGCGILPCGTYHLGLPTRIPDRTRNATELFATLLAELKGSESGAEQDPPRAAHPVQVGPHAAAADCPSDSRPCSVSLRRSRPPAPAAPSVGIVRSQWNERRRAPGRSRPPCAGIERWTPWCRS